MLTFAITIKFNKIGEVKGMVLSNCRSCRG